MEVLFEQQTCHRPGQESGPSGAELEIEWVCHVVAEGEAYPASLQIAASLHLLMSSVLLEQQEVHKTKIMPIFDQKDSMAGIVME